MTEINDQTQTRPTEDIQRAHDMLVGIFFLNSTRRKEGQPPLISEENELPLRIAVDVMCWVLNHDHSKRFSELLENLERDINEAGFAVARSERPGTWGDLFLNDAPHEQFADGEDG
jgi:hypothetical protein